VVTCIRQYIGCTTDFIANRFNRVQFAPRVAMQCNAITRPLGRRVQCHWHKLSWSDVYKSLSASILEGLRVLHQSSTRLPEMSTALIATRSIRFIPSDFFVGPNVTQSVQCSRDIDEAIHHESHQHMYPFYSDHHFSLLTWENHDYVIRLENPSITDSARTISHNGKSMNSQR